MQTKQNKRPNSTVCWRPGDANVSGQKYPEAIDNFKDALKIKPGDPVATTKLVNAEKLLALFNAEKQRKETEQKLLADKLKRYKATIVRADQFFAAKAFPEAKDQYLEAIRISDTDRYPKDKIAEIDSLMVQLAKERLLAQKRAEEQRKLQGEGSYQKNIRRAMPTLPKHCGQLPSSITRKH